MQKDWDKALPNIEAFKQMNRILKPGGIAFVMSSPRQDVLWRMLQLLEKSGFELKQSFISWIYKVGFPKAYDVSRGIDKKLGKKRKVISRERPGMVKSWEADKGWSGGITDNKPITNLAKKWEGWKSITGLKPALECILMVNKPLEGRIVDNVLKYGTGAINVDGCRIPYKSKEDFKFSHRENALNHKRDGNEQTVNYMPSYKVDSTSLKGNINVGRFPANLLCNDDILDDGKNHKSSCGGGQSSNKTKSMFGAGIKGFKSKNQYFDSGSASRYFDLDNWFNEHIFFDVPKPSKKERDMNLDKLKMGKVGHGNLSNSKGFERFDTKGKNIHPTCKPLRLMSYLIELGCSKEGIVLDPFVGSGTTCVAAKMLKRKFIGIEVNKEYINIASARIDCPIYEFKAPIIREVKIPKKEEKKLDWRKVFDST